DSGGERQVSGPEKLLIRSFSQNLIEGTVRCDNNGVLLFQTPFDSGWRIRVDRQPASAMKVDFGLLGVGLMKGEHNIELRYRPPFLIVGAIVAIVSTLFLALISLRRPASFGI